ncbi:carnitine O-palmitoyltransferase 1, liver isoform-like isoform X2 [Amphiura filiformis]|uniref:carnitine O-palmitoyltransferase 1, liver isoform-like isoform X2 n=1 Tax=Amphiura filiformis TaxID=82378 RepID=UPI003B222CCD
MAEAHVAVGFQFSVTDEGIDVNVNLEALKAVFNSGKRSWIKKLWRIKNHLHTTTYPASPLSWLAVLTLVTGCLLGGMGLAVSLVQKTEDNLLPSGYFEPPTSTYVSTIIFSTLLWLAIIYIMRYTLKILLSYRRFMYEPRGKMSLITKLWMLLTKVFCGRKPLLYSYQNSLPNLPLPSLDDTMTRYLRSVEGLLDEEGYKRMDGLVKDFKANLGPKLQRYLWLKWLWSSNYVSDWWEEYVYLRGRSPIMVNSNYYGMDAIAMKPTFKQASRAANMTMGLLTFRRAIDRETLQPIMLQNLIPLCSWQYERLFNTTRIPGLETDKLVHFTQARHVAVFHEGRFYKLFFQINGRMLTPGELEKQFQYILDDPTPPGEGEKHLGALTAGDRIPWALARQRFFSSGINKVSLHAIETAAFVVVLDDEAHEYDQEGERDQTLLDMFGRSLLHGKGYDRWFDKSFNLIVYKNGRMGVNGEHSLADAPVMAHLFEFALAEDITTLGYTEDGHCRGPAQMGFPPPTKLKWEIPGELQKIIEESLTTANGILEDVDLHLLVHNDFGKGQIKKCKVSPDAYIQIAMQLAYFRDAGKFNLTYEASMTRLYREGRTETVRPNSKESCDFVYLMESEDATKEEKIAGFQKAVDRHVNSYRDCMCGKGVDRHLFCLYVVSKYLEEESPFLKEVLSEPWRLSTSQTAHQQTNKLDIRKHPEHISAGGGFGPVADDGYGVSYIIAGEDMIFFHVSSKRSSPKTDSLRFSENIRKAMTDIRQLFDE